MNREDVLAECRRLGASVATVARTGEVRISHPALARPITMNNRRKDAPRIAEVALRRIREYVTR